MSSPSSRFLRLFVGIAVALLSGALLPAVFCGRSAGAWFEGEEGLQLGLARHLVEFEKEDDRRRPSEVDESLRG